MSIKGTLTFVIMSLLIGTSLKAQELVIHPEVECLAKNIYFEARNQNKLGQIAVGLVTLNRVKDKRFPNTVCGVVHQGTYKGNYFKKNLCQFSWYCDGKPDSIINKSIYKKIIAILPRVYYHSSWDDFTKGSTHYHTYRVSPSWKSEKVQIATIGDHIFYRWD